MMNACRDYTYNSPEGKPTLKRIAGCGRKIKLTCLINLLTSYSCKYGDAPLEALCKGHSNYTANLCCLYKSLVINHSSLV